jgi:hypothetical protein
MIIHSGVTNTRDPQSRGKMGARDQAHSLALSRLFSAGRDRPAAGSGTRRGRASVVRQ